MKITFGTHYLLTIRGRQRDRVRSFYQGVLGCTLQAHDHGVTSDIPDSIDLFHFSGGEVLGVQYVRERAPVIDTAGHKLACWMELKTDNVTGLVEKIKEFGVEEIRDFWDKEHFYFHAPGGQVFRIIGVDE